MDPSKKNTSSSSGTAGQLPAVHTPEAAIGWLLKRNGCSTPFGSPAGAAMELAPIRATAVPEDTETLDQVAGLPALLRSFLRVAEVRTVTSRHGYEGTWPAKILAFREPPRAAVDEARVAMVAYRELCRPLADEDLGEELTRLRDVLVSKREGLEDLAVGLDTMMDELGLYPADLVLWAIRFWRRNERFYPTPADLHLLIERRYGGRKAIMEALEKLIAFGSAQA